MSKERRSHLQWPGMRDTYRQDSAKLSSKGMSTKGGLHVANIDLGTIDRKDAYKEISNFESRDGGDAWSQHKFSVTDGQKVDAGEV